MLVNNRVRVWALSVLVVQLAACDRSTGPGVRPGPLPAGTVRYEQGLVISGHSLAYGEGPVGWALDVRFSNPGGASKALEYDACSVAVWLYPAGATQGPPVWNNDVNGGCFDILYIATVKSGEAHEISAGPLNADQLRGSLEPGRYDVVLAIRTVVAGSPRPPSLEVRSAGEIVLAP